MNDPQRSTPASGADASPASIVYQRLQQRREQLQQRLTGLRFRGWVFLVAAGLGALVLGAIGAADGVGMNDPWYWYALVPLGAILGAFLYSGGLVYVRMIFQLQLRFLDQQLATTGKETLQEALEEDFFTKLVKINFKYIDQYYLQTQAQADKSFTLSAVVAVVGLLIIIAGIVLMFFGKTTPAYLTTAAGVLGEFIATIFFYLYNRTILKMSEYHRKLVLTQNLSVAFKIAEGLPAAEKTRAQVMLIDRLSYDVNRLLITDPGEIKPADAKTKKAARATPKRAAATSESG